VSDFNQRQYQLAILSSPDLTDGQKVDLMARSLFYDFEAGDGSGSFISQGGIAKITGHFRQRVNEADKAAMKAGLLTPTKAETGKPTTYQLTLPVRTAGQVDVPAEHPDLSAQPDTYLSVQSDTTCPDDRTPPVRMTGHKDLPNTQPTPTSVTTKPDDLGSSEVAPAGGGKDSAEGDRPSRTVRRKGSHRPEGNKAREGVPSANQSKAEDEDRVVARPITSPLPDSREELEAQILSLAEDYARMWSDRPADEALKIAQRDLKQGITTARRDGKFGLTQYLDKKRQQIERAA
jgi:hypothetical protein